jgi:hypothetical protein
MGCILNAELIEIADTLNLGYEGKKKVMWDCWVLTSGT